MQRSYSELVQAMIQRTRSSPPARVVKLDTFEELVCALEPIDKARLFIVSIEPQTAPSISATFRPVGQDSLQLDDEVDIGSMTGNMEEYFSWFGDVETIYILGNSVAVVNMRSSFSVTHVLRSCAHDISVHGYRVMITVNEYLSECLSLNVILSILKHADPASVVMVRRVNRLGYEGAKSMKRYFSRYGEVLRIFMLPLRSRKKNLALPSKTGFLVMRKPIGGAIIAEEKEHFVLPNISVSVGRFTHRALMMQDDNTL